MEPENKLIEERLRKLKEIREMGVNPYPYSYKQTHHAKEILDKFDKKLKKEQTTKTKVSVAGRIITLRRMGRATFMHLQDVTGKIQLYLREDDIGKKNYKFLKKLDIGDHIGAKGTVFKTKTGETSVYVKKCSLLSKTLRPLPEKFHGLADQELKYRMRYLDLIINQDVKDRFIMRTKVIQYVREFLDKLNFIEVETPVLQVIYGGTNAKPFKTHINAYNMPMYLRVAPELYLKRLVVGGFERVYEIARNFRNEGVDQTHNPEFTMIEWYEAYADYDVMMDRTEDMYKFIAKKLFGKAEIVVGKKKINLAKKWPRMPLVKAIKKYVHIDVMKMSEKELAQFCEKNGVEVRDGTSKGQLIFGIFDKLVCDHLIDPIWIIDYPKEVSPLSKVHRKDDSFVERFECYIGGKEIGDGWSELIDPIGQRQRFEHEQAEMRAGQEDAHPMDEDFITCLEYGMPPLGGIGIGIDRLVMLFTNHWSIRDIMFFPIMKPEGGVQTKNDAKPKECLFLLDETVKKKFPGLKIGVAVIKDVTIKKEDKELEKEKKKIVSEIQKKAKELLKSSKSLKAYEDLYRKTGVDFTKRKPSPTALLKRLSEGKDLYKINTLVDVVNLCVMKNQMSMGVFNFDKFKLPVVLRFAKKGEKFQPLGEKEFKDLDEGEIIYADQDMVTTRDLNYRDCDKSKITEKVKNIMFFVDGTEANTEEELKEIFEDAIEQITRFVGGTVEKVMFSFKKAETPKKKSVSKMKTHPSFWADFYVGEFDAKVVKIEGDEVVLDKTCFYGESGGQAGDIGTLNKIKVINTLNNKKEIIHVLAKKPSFKTGDSVHGKIDWEKRINTMRLHSASHITEHFLFKEFGELKRIGSAVNDVKDRSDFLSDESLGGDKLKKVEDASNKFIAGKKDIKIIVDDAGYRLWKCEDIEDGCGGTHVNNTKEIGKIKLKRVNLGKGKERIETYLC